MFYRNDLYIKCNSTLRASKSKFLICLQSQRSLNEFNNCTTLNKILHRTKSSILPHDSSDSVPADTYFIAKI